MCRRRESWTGQRAKLQVGRLVSDCRRRSRAQPMGQWGKEEEAGGGGGGAAPAGALKKSMMRRPRRTCLTNEWAPSNIVIIVIEYK